MFLDYLEDIFNYCRDHTGSRMVQKIFEDGDENLKDKILEKLLPYIYTLAKDVFGNYVVQKIIECSLYSRRRSLIIYRLKGTFQELSIHTYGCRVIQKACEIIDTEDILLIFHEIKEYIISMILDQNGNHVVQKVIERLSPEDNSTIIQIFKGKVFNYNNHLLGFKFS